LSPFDYSAADDPIIGYRIVGSDTSFQVVADETDPDFYLQAYPVTGSFPIYELFPKVGATYLTWNPYSASPIKPYDGGIQGLRLLGFALRTADVEPEAAGLYNSISNVFVNAPSNYRASGEDLSVRTLSPVQAWRLEHFGSPSNTGVGADGFDLDGDGVPNGDEYVTGSGPDEWGTNCLAFAAGPGDAVTFSFPTCEARGYAYTGLERMYDLQSTSNLYDNGSWQAVPGYTNFHGTGQTIELLLGDLPSLTYYRLSTRLVPAGHP
jgi:hypothetical protein